MNWSGSQSMKNCILYVNLCCSIFVPSVLKAQLEPELPALLVSPEEYIQIAKTARATFILGPRDLILCRGQNFKGEPMASQTSTIEFAGQQFRNPGRFNNDAVTVLQGLSKDDKSRLREILQRFAAGLQSDAEFWPFLFNKARVHMVLAEFSEARQLLIRAEDLLPGYAGLDLHRGHVEARLKNETAALFYWKRSFRRDPRDVRALLALADYYRLHGSQDRAWRYLKRARRHSPSHAGVWLAEARLLWQNGQRNRARRHLTNYTIDVVPDQRRGSQLVIYYYQAELNFELHDFTEAAINFEKLLEDHQDSFWWHMSRTSIEKRLRQSKNYQANP